MLTKFLPSKKERSAKADRSFLLTETTFTDGEFGTIYRAFGFKSDCNCVENAGNDLLSETDARGYKTTYDVNEDTSRNEEVTDRCGNKTAYEYDAAGKTTKVTSKDANDTELANVSYAYDAFDNMTEIVRGDGMKYALAYNQFHNLESIGIEGKTDKLIKYTYKNGNGRLKAMTYANGHTMKAIYNTAGQMVAEKWFETEAQAADSTATPIAHYKYVYDGQGNIVRSIDIMAGKEYNYQYEEGKLIRATESDIELSGEIVTAKSVVNTVKYYYDDEGEMAKKVISPEGGSAQTVYYENSDDNTVVKFYAGGRTVTSHSKTDSFGRKVFDELQLGTGFVSRQFAYHAGDITATHKTNAKVKSSATTQLVSQIILSNGTTLSYGYDAEERITSVVETYTVDGVPVTNTTLYTYDALGQLLTETVNGEVVNSMEYDNYGNIKSKNGVVYTYGDENWKDLLTSYGDQTITYDAQGNPTSYRGHTLTWEKGRQLKKFVKSTGTVIDYTYNANGIRTSKTVDGIRHEYLLDGSKILRETWNGNTLVPLYDNEDSVCGIIYNNTPYYFLKNLQGDVIAIVDKDTTTVARYSYDAWGVCTVEQGSADIANINPFRYRGYIYDEETGFYYLRSRYYDPATQRFINSDKYASTGQGILGFNMFAYCGNDPINCCDCTGECRHRLGFWDCADCKEKKQATIDSVVCTTVYIADVSQRPFANNVGRSHYTSEIEIINFGLLIGKVTLSATKTAQYEEQGCFYSYTDIGNNENLYGFGIDVSNLVGAEFGASSELSVFAALQASVLHAQTSIGLEGVSFSIGMDLGDTSYDLEITGGWGTVVAILSRSPLPFLGQLIEKVPIYQ